jgi:hypothetical protein
MNVLILRLSNSRDTAASSTHRVLADLVLAAAPDAEIDFAFLPPAKVPQVAGLFTGRDWASFDVILVVNSFVQETLNLPWLLSANGIAPWAPDRTDAFPPVILGGSNAFAAQCLVRPNGQAVPDALFFGEAEESLPPFIRRWRTAVGDKRARLRQAADGLDGFWVTGTVPSSPVRQAVARTPTTQAAVQPLPDVETAGTVRIPVGAGCAAFCAFCFEGYERKPYREFPLSDVMALARKLKAACGARTAELDAFNLNTYAPLAPLTEQCVRLFDKVSCKSQRADGIAACPEIVDLERAAGKGSFTLGIEGISVRMRAFLSKSLSDADLYAALKALLDRRVRELKLFFILTAHETPEDLASFGEFCLRLRTWLTLPNACTRVVLSFGRLVRMPNTPLAHDRLFLDEAEWRFCVDGAAAACRRAQLECRFAFDWPDYLGTQLLAACGHEHADAVVALACNGLSYHGPWHEQEATLLQSALQADTWHGHFVRDPHTSAFPFVARAVSDAHLLKRWDEARQFIDSGYCLGAACSGCGACANAEERRAITGHSRAPGIPPAAIETVARIEAEKRRLQPAYLRAVLPDDFAGHTSAWVAARLMQTVLTRHPELVDNVLAIEECLFSSGDNEARLAIPAGETVVSLKAWNASAAQAVLAGPGAPFGVAPQQTPFAPGAFVRAAWQIFTAAAPREAARTASAWLSDLRLPHTLRRNGDAWQLDLAPAAAKKKCVFSLSVQPLAGRSTAPEDVPSNTPEPPSARLEGERPREPRQSHPSLPNAQSLQGSVIQLTFSPKAALRDLLLRLPPLSGQPKALCTEVRFDLISR